MENAILQLTCSDKKGIIANITNFIFENSGNIINLDQHTDKNLEMFFMRIEWDIENFDIKKEDLKNNFAQFLHKKNINSDWNISFSSEKPRMALFVSKFDHCFWDILIKQQHDEIRCEVPLVISNHPDLEKIANYFKVDFKYIPVNPDNKDEAEQEQLKLLKEYKIDFIVLARYMQIVTPSLIKEFENKIINIHHSFLPAFKGANPYRRAYEKGVKIIGATSHFVTEELDEGPIIAQSTTKISHKESIDELMIKGKDIEKLVLAKAVKLFTQNRVFVYGNKTIIL